MLGLLIDLHAQPWLDLHRISDVMIGLSYVAIAISLERFVSKVRHHIDIRPVTLLSFSVFIAACGMNHFGHVLYSYNENWSIFLLIADAATVVASVATALFLPMELGRALTTIMTDREKAS